MQLTNQTGRTLPASAGFFGAAVHKGFNHPLQVFLREIKSDIYAYCHYLKVTPHWQQKELFDAYMCNKNGAVGGKIACRSGKGPGKSFAASIVGSHWNLVHPYSKMVCTAPVQEQAKDVWLSQVRQLVMSTSADPRISTLFNFTGMGYGILGMPKDEWGCAIRTATRKENFAGKHKKYLGFIEEESSGVPRSISEAINETLVNPEGTYLWLKIGNPTSRTGAFFDCFNSQADKWNLIHWNAEETPESEHFNYRRNQEIEEEYGKDSDIYRVAVQGEFPSLDPDSLINETMLMKCFGPEAYARAFAHADNTKQIGIDLARFGGDECVNVFRRGRILLSMDAKSHIDPNVMIDKAVADQDSFQWKNADCMYVVDTSGMGESAVGNIGGARKMGKRVHEFYSQNTAHESAKYENKITEAWCAFAKMVKSGELYLGDKPDRRLVSQLTNRKYGVSSKSGKIRIETKDEYKTRNKDQENGELGKSPDRADGVVMAFYPHATQSQRLAFG